MDYSLSLSLLFWCSNCPIFGQWEPLMSFWHDPVILWAHFKFLTQKSTLYLSCTFLVLALKSTISPQSLSFFKWRMVLKSQDLNIYGMLIASMPTWWTELRNRCMYIHSLTYLYVFLICIFLYIHIYWSSYSNSSLYHRINSATGKISLSTCLHPYQETEGRIDRLTRIEELRFRFFFF